MNPILSGFNPDPTVVSVNGDYFLATSTFELFPGIAIYHSKDLRAWSLIGHALTRKSQLNLRTVEPSAGIWAPTLRFHRGTYYVVCSCFDFYRPSENKREFPLGFYVKTGNIWDASSWSECVYFNASGFDQDLFWDNDKCYLTYTRKVSEKDAAAAISGGGPRLAKNFGTYVSEVDLETGTSLTRPVLLKQSPSGVAEGPHLYKRNGFYYLLVAEGGTSMGHHEIVLRSDKIYGPYKESPYGSFLQSSNEAGAVHDSGHADIFEDIDKNWWVVFLGYRHKVKNGLVKESPLGRETFMIPFEWQDDDWPTTKNQGQCYLGVSDKFQPMAGFWNVNSRTESKTLSPHWYTKHTPQRQFYSLSQQHETLTLYGLPYTLDSREHVSAVFHKQPSFDGVFSVELRFGCEPDEPYEAGITIWYSMYSHAALGLVSSEQKDVYKLMYRVRVVGEEPSDKTVASVTLRSKESLTLLISCSFDEYRLGYTRQDSRITVGDITSSDLLRVPPPGGLYTGVMFGLYATGNGEPSLKPADFHNMKWSPVDDLS